MSLDWSIGKCANWQELKEDAEWPTTNAIIWWCMGTDVGTLKSQGQCEEWLARYLFACKLDNTEPKITLADLIRRIGLSTNVSTMTRSQWLKKAMTIAMRQADSEVRAQAKEMGR